MSAFREDILTNLQDDLKWPLLADEYFADVNVFDFHHKELESKITNALGVLTPTGGKIGACVVVLPLQASDEYADASRAHPLTIRVTYRVCEDPVFNFGPSGTLKTAFSIASRLRHVLKHYILEGFASGLVPDGEQFIVPVEDGIAPSCYDVNFTCKEQVDQNLARVMTPRILVDETTGEVELLCDTVDATIYYTIDGSYPFTSARAPNTGAIVYTVPFVAEGEFLLRVGAFKEAHLPSNIRSHRFENIGSDGEGLHAIS